LQQRGHTENMYSFTYSMIRNTTIVRVVRVRTNTVGTAAVAYENNRRKVRQFWSKSAGTEEEKHRWFLKT
jgi:hypothetical protein